MSFKRPAARGALALLILTAGLLPMPLVAAELQVGVFSAEATPAIGEGPCVGFMSRVESVEHPLLLKGIVLRRRGQTFVLAAIDYCGICNASDRALRQALAEAAQTQPEL